MPRPARLAYLRARIRYPLLRRAQGAMAGRHRSIYLGHGQDFAELAEYRPGDDVGDIDWKSSARSGKPIIKRFEREAAVSLQLVVDTGRTMAGLAPSGETKAEIAAHIAGVLAYLANGRNDPVGLVSGGADQLRLVPPRHGVAHLEALLATLTGDVSPAGHSSDLTPLLRRAATAPGVRGLVVVITDEARPTPAAEPELRRLRTRHDVLVFRVADMSPMQAGAVVIDVENGELPSFLQDTAIQEEAARAAAQRRHAVEGMLRSHGIPSVVVSSAAAAEEALVEILGRRRGV